MDYPRIWNLRKQAGNRACTMMKTVSTALKSMNDCCGAWPHMWVVGIFLAGAGAMYLHPQNASPCRDVAASDGVLSLRGINMPRTVSGPLKVRAVSSMPVATMIYLVDGKEVSRKSCPPYDLDLRVGASSASSSGHVLTACAITRQGILLRSAPVPFTALPDIADTFSADLSPYTSHPSALAEDMETLLARTVTAGVAMSDEEVNTRRLAFGMYLNLGIDPSLDAGNDQSEVLAALLPSHASAPHVTRGSWPLSMRFSQDSVFYHPIPKEWPRIAVPKGYIKQVQFSTAYHGDGIGFGEVVASASDPIMQVRSQWYDVKSTARVFSFRMPVDWSSHLPTLPEGDLHLIFVDSVSNTFISSYKTSKNALTGEPNALFASSPHALDGMADSGGSIAAGFAELPLLVQPGEATNPKEDIPHAIGGAVGRVWAARVYPATSRDAGVQTSINSCTHQGFTNTGIVPYGGIIQLDPDLDLATLHLSLPAYRILRAMQVYGYYVMDFGCADLDIYTAMNSQELDPFGGPWGNANGPGAQNEIQKVIARSALYIVPPPIKR
jgi:hypothetical protein